MQFDGETYEHDRDGKRLGKQYIAVLRLMSDGVWRSLGEIADAVGAPEASVSARLRDARKHRFGGHRVDRIYIENGLHFYRMVINRGE